MLMNGTSLVETAFKSFKLWIEEATHDELEKLHKMVEEEISWRMYNDLKLIGGTDD